MLCRGEKLWVPTNNESQRNNVFVTDNFPSLARIEFMYLEREDGGDVLTPEAFNKALSLHNDITTLAWKNLKDQDAPAPGKLDDTLPEEVMLRDLCFNRQAGEGAEDVLDCSIGNVIELFGCALHRSFSNLAVLHICLLLTLLSLSNGLEPCIEP